MLNSRKKMKFSILTFLFEKKPTYPDQNYSKIEMLQATKDFTQRNQYAL